MADPRFLDAVRQAATDYASSEHRLRLAVTAARQADEPIAAIAKAAGVTRQTVYNWSQDYDQGHGLTVSDRTPLAELPTQRPRTVKGAPVLVLTRSKFPTGRPRWDGHIGKAVAYAGDLLGVTLPNKIVDIIAHSWALIGDASGQGVRPEPGDRVICLPDDNAGDTGAALGTVADSTGPDGPIDVIEADGVTRCNRWAIVLPADSQKR
jgi:Homeodomain-like domain